jgi:inosine-uridine nucleoside N-ribohydrolase
MKKQESTVLDKVVTTESNKIKLLFDTDANNELDDQHALAYMLLNGDIFEVVGITVNATDSGGTIQKHYDEANRILQLCNLNGKIPLLLGANEDFKEISQHIDTAHFDGQAAVDFILEKTKKEKLIVVAVGKLTNIALALKKDPSFAERTKIVWLGSNYPESGEYNQDNDTLAMNYVLNSNIPFEMVTVRYGKPSGTDAVSVSHSEINSKMPGLGPEAKQPIIGRHGGEFKNFGDYSVNLFDHIDYHSEAQTRPLFDMVALAIVKNPDWGKQKKIPAPILINNHWVERPNNKRVITLWENFNKAAILNDFYTTLEHPVPVKTTNNIPSK